MNNYRHNENRLSMGLSLFYFLVVFKIIYITAYFTHFVYITSQLQTPTKDFLCAIVYNVVNKDTPEDDSTFKTYPVGDIYKH